MTNYISDNMTNEKTVIVMNKMTNHMPRYNKGYVKSHQIIRHMYIRMT